jgi:hypothetical protein
MCKNGQSRVNPRGTHQQREGQNTLPLSTAAVDATRNAKYICSSPSSAVRSLYSDTGPLFCGEGPRSRCYELPAAFMLIVKICNEDDYH